MNTLEMLRTRKAEIGRVTSIHGARNIHVFGSAVRSEDMSDATSISWLIWKSLAAFWTWSASS